METQVSIVCDKDRQRNCRQDVRSNNSSNWDQCINAEEEMEDTRNQCGGRRSFIDLTLFVLFLALSFVIGFIVGSVTELLATLGVGAMVVLVTTLVLLIVLNMIKKVHDE